MDLQKIAEPIVNIALAVRWEMERIGEHHSCILTSAVLTDVLQRKGQPNAFTSTVRAQILNPSFTKWVKQFGFPTDPASQEKCDQAGGRLIGLGSGKPKEMPKGVWAGHACVIIPGLFGDKHAMSDVTITQACKSDWGVELPPLFVRVSEEFVRGEKEFKGDVNGCLVIYKAFPDDHEFEIGPLWTDKGRITAIADKVISSLNS